MLLLSRLEKNWSRIFTITKYWLLDTSVLAQFIKQQSIKAINCLYSQHVSAWLTLEGFCQRGGCKPAKQQAWDVRDHLSTIHKNAALYYIVFYKILAVICYTICPPGTLNICKSNKSSSLQSASLHLWIKRFYCFKLAFSNNQTSNQTVICYVVLCSVIYLIYSVLHSQKQIFPFLLNGTETIHKIFH